MKDNPKTMNCPHCAAGRIYTSNAADVTMSVICHICKRKYYADLKTGKTYKPREYKKNEKIRPMTRTLHCPQPGCSGKAMADGSADAYVSVRCAKCKNYYVTDLLDETSQAVKPVREGKLNMDHFRTVS